MQQRQVHIHLLENHMAANLDTKQMVMDILRRNALSQNPGKNGIRQKQKKGNFRSEFSNLKINLRF